MGGIRLIMLIEKMLMEKILIRFNSPEVQI